MKATINGVTVEGTPSEIAEYQRLVNEGNAPKQPFVFPSEPPFKPWWPYGTEIISGDIPKTALTYVSEAKNPL